MKAGLRVRVSGALNLALNELRRTRAQIAATAVLLGLTMVSLGTDLAVVEDLVAVELGKVVAA